MIELEEALNIIRGTVKVAEPVPVPLDQALGLRLADEIRAPSDFPPFDRSTMDGYALRADEASEDSPLRVVGTVYAGDPEPPPLSSGEAVRILTGAPLPHGADAVLPAEDAVEENGLLRAMRPLEPGEFVDLRGSYIRKGERALSAGAEIDERSAGVLSAFGRTEPVVYPRARIALFSTGSELLNQSGTSTIPDINRWTLSVYFKRKGLDVAFLGILPDVKRDILRALQRSTELYQITVTTGGVSVGERDFLPLTVEELGGEILFHRVRIRPGKPTLFARVAGNYLFGLPGNPVSALVTARLFLLPAASILQGGDGALEFSDVQLDGELFLSGERTHLLPGILTGRTVSLVPCKGSGDIFGFARGNCLIRAEPGIRYTHHSPVRILHL